MRNKLVPLALLAISACLVMLLWTAPPVDHAETIRVGWTTSWACQGQMVEAAKEISGGADFSFIGFSAGPPAVEAALADEIDIVSGALLPMLRLIDADSDWTIICRNAMSRQAILVPPNSQLTSIADLRGKTVGLPVGTGVEAFVLMCAEDAALQDGDLRVLNLGIQEVAETVQSGTKTSWGQIDAVSAWEPTATLLEEKGLARAIAENNAVTVTLMRKSLIRKKPEALDAFLGLIRRAWYTYAKDKARMNNRFRQDTSTPLEDATLNAIAQVEPNTSVASLQEVRITLDVSHFKQLQQSLQFLKKKQLLRNDLKVEEIVHQIALQELSVIEP